MLDGRLAFSVMDYDTTETQHEPKPMARYIQSALRTLARVSLLL